MVVERTRMLAAAEQERAQLLAEVQQKHAKVAEERREAVPCHTSPLTFSAQLKPPSCACNSL